MHGTYVFQRKRVVAILEFLLTYGRWGDIFATTANHRSCVLKVAVSPSFTVCMGENVKPNRLTFE